VSLRPSRPIASLLSLSLAVGFLLASAIPVAACSCMAPGPMATYAGDPSQSVFTGVVQAPDTRGVPVQVTRWFQGTEMDAIVWLDASGFGGDGANCGTQLPLAGTEWIYVAYRVEVPVEEVEGQPLPAGTPVDTGLLGVNICTPQALLSDPAGQTLLADAEATFGEGVSMDPDASAPPGSPDASDGSGLPVQALLVGGIALVAVIAGVVFVMGRRRGDETVDG
jgi:hypothetical protein